jgi:hypothetical protein
LLQRIEEIILFYASKEEDIVEDVEPGFPRKKKLKEEVKTRKCKNCITRKKKRLPKIKKKYHGKLHITVSK